LALQKEISNALSLAISKGYQIHPDAFAMLKSLEMDASKIIEDIIKIKQKADTLIVVEDIKNIITTRGKITSTNSIDSIVNSEMTSSNTTQYYQPLSSEEYSYKVILDPTYNINSNEGVEDYTALFRSRFEKSLRILALRPSSKRITKITSLKQNTKLMSHATENRTTDSYSVIAGLLMSKHFRKNTLEMVIDDYTGILNVIASTEALKKQASMLVLDQMVMLEIENHNNKKGIHSFTIKNIVSPDIPDHLPNRSKSESYVVLISDLHVGSKYFMEAEFVKFLTWLSTDNDEIIQRIKFLCIGGDLIDGIGIFPNQDKELLEMNTNKQMMHAISLLAKIPKHINVFVIPGNHDPGRRALPQPAIPRKDSDKLYSLNNFTMLGNPSFVELNGVKILMYHGQGLDDIIAMTPGQTYSKPSEAMKILLKARHLSPIYGERTPIAPEKEDMMVINETPDIFHSGHIHIIDVQNYRGTLIVNSGAWQAQTNFQRTMGILPTPGIAIMVNLATLKPFQMNFTQ
jgi:DNA polymerase II small subunit